MASNRIENGTNLAATSPQKKHTKKSVGEEQRAAAPGRSEAGEREERLRKVVFVSFGSVLSLFESSFCVFWGQERAPGNGAGGFAWIWPGVFGGGLGGEEGEEGSLFWLCFSTGGK
jgi:hypothetical protein